MLNSLSCSVSHGSSSGNSVTHCRQEQGMRVISVPQNMRSGPKAASIWRRYGNQTDVLLLCFGTVHVLQVNTMTWQVRSRRGAL